MTAFNFGSKVLHAATVVAVLLCSSIQSVSGFAFSTSLTSPSRGLARPQHNLQRKPQLFMTSVELDNDFPSCVPFPEVLEIKEDKAIDVLKSIRQVSLPVPEYIAELTVETSYVKVGPSRAAAEAGRAAPLVLLHGFDSSVCEFRRLLPELDARGQETYALDILGWGFNQYLGVKDFSAEAKLDHLYAFWREVVGGRPMALGGASLGGGIALEFAYRYPEAVERLVLIDAQGYIDGAGPGGALPAPLARLGIQVLKSKWLRMLANKIAYYDKEKYATEDAMNVGRLHALKEGWDDAACGYMLSGGFEPSKKVPQVATETLVLWGRNDEILDPKQYAERFPREMPRARLEWVEACGHCPHLEQPAETADKIVAFIQEGVVKEVEVPVKATTGGGGLFGGIKFPWDQQ
mmetsp:Transcript_15004/g.26628  ORF Transcript_15004/g.26628 Transcript_15004/m.26628 type:complete len:406 (-) Transcript_15004:533-1750(-)